MSSEASHDVPGGWRRKSVAGPVLTASGLLIALIFLSIILNPSDLSISKGQIIAALIDRMPGLSAIPHEPPDSAVSQILWEIRIPRALGAALVGALLAYAGVAFQGLLMNPLAEPYTVGVSAGGALGAAIIQLAGLSAVMLGFAGALAAFAGGMAAIALVYSLASVNGRVAVHAFLLAGVVVGTLLWSLIPLMLFFAGHTEQMSSVMFYIVGSVNSIDWSRVFLLIPFLTVTALALHVSTRELNLMAIGEEAAAHLGVETESFKRRVLFVGSLATAASVSVAGIIAFVGLVVPHLARMVAGPDHRTVLPLSALIGSCLLLSADVIARVVLQEMPVGVITSLLGAPMFCILMRKPRQAQ